MAAKAPKSNFSTALLELKQEFDNFTGTGTFKTSNDALILDESGKEVLVRITTGRASGFVPGAKALGFDLEDSQSELNFIEEFIPIEKIDSSLAEKLENKLLLGVIPVYEPIVTAGDATSQADFIQEANRVRSSLPIGYDGTGIEVGVLSDSYNSRNGAAADIASGDLPNDVTVISRDGVEQDLPSGYSDEGRAMLQLVHDLAPGADLSFATAFTGETGFAANIRALADDGADIIVDDVIYFAEPFFQDGVVALAVDDV